LAVKIERYTNRQRRNNILRERCHRFVREQMPEQYAEFRAEAERQYRIQNPAFERDRYHAAAAIHR
jgi:hypothetical protein